LDEEGDDVFDVAVEGVEGGKPEANAERGGDGEKEKNGEPKRGEGGAEVVDGGDDGEDEEADGEIHEAGDDGGDGKDETREVHLGDDALIFDDDVGGGLKGRGEVGPRDEGGEIEDGIRKAERGELREATEKESEDQHGEERLEDDPSDADGGLLVADLYVAPDKEEEEFAVEPEFGERKSEPRARRLDANDGGSERRERSSLRRRCGDGSHARRRKHSERMDDRRVEYQRRAKRDGARIRTGAKKGRDHGRRKKLLRSAEGQRRGVDGLS
jgi:hypothetical protein